MSHLVVTVRSRCSLHLLPVAVPSTRSRATSNASALSPQAALRVVDELGLIRRLVDGMTAKAAKRAIDGDAHVGFGAKAVAHTLGVATGEVRAAIKTASQLESLPYTDRAVREGLLSARAAQLIADAAIANPAAAARLLETAEHSNRAAGNSGRPTPRPESANCGRHRRAPHEISRSRGRRGHSSDPRRDRLAIRCRPRAGRGAGRLRGGSRRPRHGSCARDARSATRPRRATPRA
jgi:hypothetical protein